MARSVQRFLFDDLAGLAATTKAASSVLSTAPLVYLRSELRSKVPRTALGWTIKNAVNDRIEFTRSAVLYTATIAAGTYVTGASLAAAIVTAMEAVDATPVWACTYDSGTHKFTISSNLAFVLNVATTIARNMFPDIGFTGADTSSNTSHLGNGATYQSRHWITFDLGSAMNVDVAALFSSNLSATGTSVLEGASSAFTTIVATPAASLSITGSDMRIGFFDAPQSYRYWRLLVNDITNADGFFEGKFRFGEYDELWQGVDREFSEGGTDYSSVLFAEQGAYHRNARAKSVSLNLGWTRVDASDVAIFQALQASRGVGGCFLLFLDAEGDDPAARTFYGAMTEPLNFTRGEPEGVDVSMKFIEALG